MTTSATSDVALWKRGLRSVAVTAVFAVVGPAMGGLLVFCAVYPILMMLGLNSGQTVAEGEVAAAGAMAMLGPLSLFMALAYAFGGVQALLTGLWAGIATWRSDGFSGRAVVLAAIAASLIWIAILYSPLNPLDTGNADGADKVGNATQIALTITPIGIACAVFCRWLCRVLGLVTPAASTAIDV